MPIRQAVALLQFLLLALACFGGAYYFTQRTHAKPVAKPIALVYSSGAAVVVE